MTALADVAQLRRCWHPVCFADALGGGPLARTVLGIELVVWAPAPGVVAAALDRCPHRDARLSRGELVDGCLRCPYHGWRFDEGGRCVAIPQLPAGVPAPPRAHLHPLPVRLHYGCVWVLLEEPALLDLPTIPEMEDDGWRVIPEFDETWACSAAHLIDNNFDPGHVAWVHDGTFGDRDNPLVADYRVTPTASGFEMVNELEVRNRAGQEAVSGSTGATTVRRTVSEFRLPFTGVLRTTYPTGVTHVHVKIATPVDAGTCRLLQWSIRDDTEDDVPARDIVAFDRRVTIEDRAVLETTWPDYRLELQDNVHLRSDKASIEMRRALRRLSRSNHPHDLEQTR